MKRDNDVLNSMEKVVFELRSIIKNNSPKPGVTRKLYYDESVYRVGHGSNTFKEILQSGLECIGATDSYQIGEVLLIAARSLAVTGRRFVLDVCQMHFNC